LAATLDYQAFSERSMAIEDSHKVSAPSVLNSGSGLGSKFSTNLEFCPIQTVLNDQSVHCSLELFEMPCKRQGKQIELFFSALIYKFSPEKTIIGSSESPLRFYRKKRYRPFEMFWDFALKTIRSREPSKSCWKSGKASKFLPFASIR
jgi:hypothetical protein